MSRNIAQGQSGRAELADLLDHPLFLLVRDELAVLEIVAVGDLSRSALAADSMGLPGNAVSLEIVGHRGHAHVEPPGNGTRRKFFVDVESAQIGLVLEEQDTRQRNGISNNGGRLLSR